MKQFKLNDKVIIPEGYIGVIVEESPVGEYRIVTSTGRQFFYYAEDIEPWPKKEVTDDDSRGL